MLLLFCFLMHSVTNLLFCTTEKVLTLLKFLLFEPYFSTCLEHLDAPMRYVAVIAALYILSSQHNLGRYKCPSNHLKCQIHF